MGRKPAIPEKVKEEALRRLKEHVRKKYIGKYGVEDVIGYFKGAYFYIDWVEKSGGLLGLSLSGQSGIRSKLCRLRYTGGMENWGFGIYKYSDECYADGDFPFEGGGTIEECFDSAASLYITRTFP